MSDVRGLTAQNMLDALPVAAANDEELQRQAEVIVQFLETRYTELTALEIYRMVAEMTDELPETMLDTLAYDFKIDWWDPDYSLEEKRQTLRDNWKVHRTLGTKGAVETGLSAIYPETTAVEWFEYDGVPYHFKLRIDVSHDTVDLEKQARVLKRLEYYKNLRSWLDGIEYIITLDDPITAIAGAGFTGMYCRFDVIVKGLENVDWPHLRMETGGVVVPPGLQRLHLPVDVPETVGWPTAKAEAQAGGAAVHVRQVQRLTVPVNGVDWPTVRAETKAGGGASYEKIYVEVKVNGLEQ